MKLAASNIAWPHDKDEAVAEALVANGFSGIEIAPTKVWPRPLEVGDAEADAYRHRWAAHGIVIAAAQALLFGRPDLTLFENADARRATRDYLAGMVRLCGRLGTEAMVFGSPKNRHLHGMPYVTAFAIAVDFFGDLADLARAAGTHVVFEANPPQYGTDFVTGADEAIRLVRAVNHPGFRLHLDTACMTLAGDDIAATFEAGFPLLRHFHISAPALTRWGRQMESIMGRLPPHLRACGYEHWVSVEMRQSEPFVMAELTAALNFVRSRYD